MAMSPTELKALLQAEKASALGIAWSTLSSERTRAIDYYMGEMKADMPSQEGRSSAVSQDVLDTVEGLMPPLMEIFAQGEEVVRFEPVGIEDEEAAEQESDYVNHVFMQKNPGFLVLYSFIKDALLSKVGIVKVDWDESEEEERETYYDQPDDVFAVLQQQPDVEVAEHTEHVGPDGSKLHDVTLVKRKQYGCAKAMAVPPEEFGIAKRARSIHDAPYCFHEVQRSESELIEQGFDAAQVRKLPTWGETKEQEELARDTVEEEQTAVETLNKAMRPIKVTEHYIKMDWRGDGKVCPYRITTGGDELEVLNRSGKPDVVQIDAFPFAAMTPVIITHRFFGRSIADLVLDIQRIKTALLRGLLDNIYLLNNQRYEIADSHAHERTLDDLLVNRPGGIIRTKMPGGLIPIQNQPLGNALFPAIEYMDATREWRTGVTRQGQGIDANALQNQSATAVNQAFTAAQARMKLIARIFAETGIRDLFSLLHGVIRKNDRQANTVRLRNKWVTVDPRNWKTREDMTINVGLGTGSKEQQIMFLMQVLGIQKEAMMAPQMMLVEPKNIYNTLEKLVEKGGLKSIEPYFMDPTAPGPDGQPKQPPEPPPDPAIVVEQMKGQQRAQEMQMDAQLQERSDQRKAEIEQVQAQADIATNQQKVQMDAAVKEREFELKRELAILEFQLKEREAEREEARKEREHSQRMQQQQDMHEHAMRQGAVSMVAGVQQHEQKMEQSEAAAKQKAQAAKSKGKE